MATVTDLEKAIATNERYAANYRKAGKSPAKYLAKIATLKAELAALSAPKAAPKAASGLPNCDAAELDAGFVFQASLGNVGGADTNPAPGAAKALGWSGVVGDGIRGYGVFRDGVLTGTVSVVPPNGWPFTFGVAAGIDPNAPYTGPGAARP
jgi:hypothetical protein